MSMQLWAHQTKAITAAETAIRKGQRRGLWVMPTGSGKTMAFTTLAARLDRPTLTLVHRRELLRQTIDTFDLVWPAAQVATLPEKGQRHGRVVVATVQSLSRRLADFPRDAFELLVIDEAHHGPARQWQKVLDHFRPAFALGCTATPHRLDRQSVEDLFGGVIYEYPLVTSIADGVVVPLRQHGILTRASLAGVPVRRDFKKQDLARAVLQAGRSEAVVQAYLDHARGRPALVFATDLEHVRQLDEVLRRRGVASAAVTGKMKQDERGRVLARFRRGELQALVSCEVLTEGYDERRVRCVVMARPTASRALYYQCVGRGMRADPTSGKAECLVIDVIDRGASKRGVVASELFGARVRDCGGGDPHLAAQREMRHWPLYPLSPNASLEAAWELEEETPWGELPSLGGYVPTAGWHDARASAKQVKALRRQYRFDIHRDLTRGEASHLLDRCKDLDELHPVPATPAQVRMLASHGSYHPGMTKREATRRIVQLKEAM
jgi:superfamily II DNA or RNA helicase